LSGFKKSKDKQAASRLEGVAGGNISGRKALHKSYIVSDYIPMQGIALEKAHRLTSQHFVRVETTSTTSSLFTIKCNGL